LKTFAGKRDGQFLPAQAKKRGREKEGERRRSAQVREEKKKRSRKAVW